MNTDKNLLIKLWNKLKESFNSLISGESPNLVFWILPFSILIIFFLIPLILTQGNWGKDYSDTGQIGDTIGGITGPIIALIAALLTFIAFWIQFKANIAQTKQFEQQNIDTKKDRFRSIFFELLTLQRENVNQLNYTKPESDNEEPHISKTRKVFKVIFSEFLECYTEVKKVLGTYDVIEILEPTYHEKQKEIAEKNNIDIKEMTSIDLAYNFILFGVNIEGRKTLETSFKNKIAPDILSLLIEFIKLKPKKNNSDRWEKWGNLNKNSRFPKLIVEFSYYKSKNSNAELKNENIRYLDYKKEFLKYYGGHQHRLGHYFRHLFQIYKFIHYSKEIDQNEKYFYGKIIRAQLSTYEQALLFISSISSLGLSWEFKPESEIGESTDNKLITKYHIIKNLPGNNLSGIEYKKYYPDVKFEIED